MPAAAPKLHAKDVQVGRSYRLKFSSHPATIISRVQAGIWTAELKGREITILLADIEEEFTGTDRLPCAPSGDRPPTAPKSTTDAARSHQFRDGKALGAGKETEDADV